MESIIAVYDTHAKAVNAVKALNADHFPMKEVSLLGKAEIIEDNIHIKSYETIEKAPAIVGMGAGALLGLLSGIGVLAVPGFGFLYGAGAFAGIVAGFDFGIITGGLVSFFAYLGFKEDVVVKLDEHLKAGKFMLIVKGSLEEVLRAERILHTEGTHLEFVQQ